MNAMRFLCFILLSGLAGSVWGGSLTLGWTNNLLTIAAPHLPGEKIEVWYLEAFCRSNAHHQSWDKTKVPHKTTLLRAASDRLEFLTTIAPDVEMRHEVVAKKDEIELDFELINRGKSVADLDWFQPACIRVQNFTGRNQSNYTKRAFIFTEKGLTPLADTRRTEVALYRGGQVYLPAGILHSNANPRPISGDRPVNGLLGCFSMDDRWLLATASDRTHELFEGVYVCLHSDPQIGGLKPGERKKVRSKIYIMTNDVQELLKRYRHDFGAR